jgi:hypothetical protein
MASSKLDYQSKYKGVCKIKPRSKNPDAKLWLASFSKNTRLFMTEKEAAKAVDMHLISKGKEPVNILVRK